MAEVLHRPGQHPARRHRPNTPHRPGFLLLDLLLAIVVIAILTAVVVPSLRPNDSLKLISAATMITADLEFAQSATLDDPGDPIIVRVDDDAPRYWLAKLSDPETPITKSSGAPYEVEFGTGTAEFLTDVSLTLEQGKNGAVVFDAFGRLDQTADASIVLTAPTGELAVVITASTGSVAIGD